MRGPASTNKAHTGKRAAPRSLLAPALIRPRSSPHATSAELLLQNKYQTLTRKHLDRLFVKIFAEFTGLHFRIAWAPTGSGKWDQRALPSGCSVCCRLAGRNRMTQARCETLGQRRLERVLHQDGEGLAFKCWLGVQNHWLPIRVDGATVGVAYLQALDKKSSGSARSGRAEARALSPAEFHRASRLFRLIIQHVQTLDLAAVQQTELTNAGHAVVALEKEQTRLHAALQRHLPDVAPVVHRAGREARPAQVVVQSLLEWISQHYAEPFTLQQCAAKLGLNAAYLSVLFSSIAGRPFKVCLTERRMEKARELLGKTTLTLSEVATAVGYAGENRFRAAFKKLNGLSPKSWRETMRVKAH